MEAADLYKLPKDVLVHLISTIQYDLATELEQTKRNSKRKVDAIREKCEFAAIYECSFEGCHRFWLYEEHGDLNNNDVDYYNDGSITFCCGCDKYRCDLKADKGIGFWCREHVPSNFLVENEGDNFRILCNNCKGCYEMEG
jgi:hypothetical protein